MLNMIVKGLFRVTTATLASGTTFIENVVRVYLKIPDPSTRRIGTIELEDI
jgi:hypothetical protein